MATKKIVGLLLTVLLVCCQTKESAAQARRVRTGPPVRPPIRHNEWGPQCSPTYTDVEPHHCSTEFEGAARGMGYFYRGLGAGLRDVAEGQAHYAHARQLELENLREAVYLRNEIDELNAQLRAARRARQASPEELAKFAKVMRPAPLSEHELSPDGTIQWPTILCSTRYDRSRRAINVAMHRMAVESDPRRGAELCRGLIAECESLQAELRMQIEVLPGNEYMSGRKFLDSLRCELTHPSLTKGREYLVAIPST